MPYSYTLLLLLIRASTSPGPGLCHRLQIWWLPLCIAPLIDGRDVVVYLISKQINYGTPLPVSSSSESSLSEMIASITLFDPTSCPRTIPCNFHRLPLL